MRRFGPAARVGLATVALTLSLSPAAAGDPADGGSDDDVERGRRLYRVYCVACHGESGRGDGPAAAGLDVPPADLTRLGPRGPAFPRDEIYRTIEGIETRPDHRSSDMPAWGLTLRQDGLDAQPADEIRARIGRLVAYLESIQAEAD